MKLATRQLKNHTTATSLVAAMVSFLLLIVNQWASADEASLVLAVQGNVLPRLAFGEGSRGTTSHSLLTFAAKSQRSSAFDLESAVAEAKVMKTDEFPASVALSAPSRCAVGGAGIADSRIKVRAVVQDSKADTVDLLNIGGSESFRYLVSVSAGALPVRSGSDVSCGLHGTLTYTY